ncbi:Alpha/Beta hydrolase protein [Rhodocollybia butyracea]|uniref:Carboxylic ester hydrolase n=1 Tax=Rhodocollybia butyracea TaxID=206335 RepID=A0A9P5UDW9_9AGAR|nr:Alpha/Beta hydrolase protein [Rhodocollybia butyracea]
MIIPFVLIFISLLEGTYARSFVTVSTTSGSLQGVKQDGGRFAQPPIGLLRWAPPLPFFSNTTQNATAVGPACVQQFAFATASLIEPLFNNPLNPPAEDEDCLFLNVWAPTRSSDASSKPVVFWIYGGSLAFGTGSLPEYDGTSIASNQGIVVVSFNYRTNVFGFPGAPELLIQENNLGFLDQELALEWVRLNIRQFGGDPEKITIMGQSAGGFSVSGLVVRHPIDPPFRAAISFSGASPDNTPSLTPFDSFNNFSTTVGCTEAPGPARLACLRTVSAVDIRAYTNGPLSGSFEPLIDNITTFADNLERIRSGNAARVPLLAGSMQDDGTLFTVGETNLTAFLISEAVTLISAEANETSVIADSFRDLSFLCPTSLWTQAFVQSGISHVYRYDYGAVFSDFQAFPNAGAWHSTELPEFFGTFNASTATPDQVTLSKTFQTAIANFIKNPNRSPAPNWPEYVPGNNTQTLARLAYNNNVEIGNFVQAVTSDSQDAPCAVWNTFLDF